MAPAIHAEPTSAFRTARAKSGRNPAYAGTDVDATPQAGTRPEGAFRHFAFGILKRLSTVHA
jgi:hypothetical protein